MVISDPLPPFKLLHDVEAGHEDAILAVKWSKSEKSGSEFIITGSHDDNLKMWSVSDDKFELGYSMQGYNFGVISIDVSKDGRIGAANSLDSNIRLWDLDTTDEIQRINSEPFNSWMVRFFPESDMIATATIEGKIYLHKTSTGEKLSKELVSNGIFTLSIAVRSDGKQVAGGSQDGMIRLYDVETGSITATLEGHAMPIRALEYSPDGKYLVTGSDDKHIKIYSIERTELVATLSGHGSWVLDLSFSPDNKHFASCSCDNTVKIWDIESRKCVATMHDHKQKVNGVKFSPDGNSIVSVSDDRSIKVYRLNL